MKQIDIRCDALAQYPGEPVREAFDRRYGTYMQLRSAFVTFGNDIVDRIGDELDGELDDEV